MQHTAPRSRSARRADEVLAAFEGDYMAYQYCWVEFFIEHLADLSRIFRGDLQSMMVLALVGQVTIRATRTAVKAGTDPAAIPAERLSISASRIADVTGIPRETVRRRLAALERKGWLVRTGDAAWKLAMADGIAAARLDLAAIDRRAMVRLARLFADFEVLVEAHTRRQAEQACAEGAQDGQADPPRDAG
ncbi:helix-turn-helix domain-containing protein [Paracoccus sp. WLY502]|uniref:helix-turn-helix domain-containing protein n=1 Tax=Paracoccus yibinensis TaxID=3068891 RepID=UPI002796DB69|nr:helix-turn-helix domain-containing protein [Paracoccus sp. WLY502]MDQ1900674.1 helix-turn-helix domain-containing protein [Paracoccus sp. WLY502]